MRLFVFSLSIVFGVASIVSVLSFSRDLRRSVEQEAKSLLGADILFRLSSRPDPEQSSFLASIPGERSEEINFTTMAVAPKTGATRLVQVRAFDGKFPFYGEIRTSPPEAFSQYQQSHGLIADPILLRQLQLSIGGSLKIGESEFRIAGTIEKIPGESPMWESIAPRVFIPIADLPSTNLLRFGSRASYRTYVKLPEDTSAKTVLDSVSAELRKNRFAADTVEDRKRGVERVMNNVEFFLSLAGVFSLMLGALGVAGGASIYLAGKRPAVAILRCVGAKQRDAVRVFFVQILAASLCAAIVGTALGIAFQYALPAIFKSILPSAIATQISWRAVLLGIVVGTAAAVWSCGQILNELGTASPLVVLRGVEEVAVSNRRRMLASGSMLGVLLFVVSVVSARTFGEGWKIFAILICCMAALRLTGALIQFASRKLIQDDAPYTIRQGYRNLSRPGNQTALLTFSVGAVVLLATTALLIRSMLVEQVQLASRAGGADTIFFDVQPDQFQSLSETLAKRSVPVLDSAPVVTMRLVSVKGHPVKELLENKESSIPEWTLKREYRSTYRDHLSSSEILKEGSLSAAPVAGESVAVSLEEGIAEKLGVQRGDELVFDVQGLEVPATVGSIREVDWQRLQSNFFIVFPTGVLEAAPQFFVLAARAGSEAAAASLQEAIVRLYPNISVFDLRGAIRVLDEILGKFGVVFDCIGASVLCAALIVLCGTLYGSFQSRLREQALLKAVGATQSQIIRISAVEFVSLATLGGLSGGLLAVIASKVLAGSILKVAFVFSAAAVALPLLVAIVLVSLLGLFVAGKVYRRATMDVLRVE